MRSMRLISGVAALASLAGGQLLDPQPNAAPLAGQATQLSSPTAPAPAFGSSSPQTSGSGAQASLHPGQIEFCGLGWFDKEPDEAQKAALGPKLLALAGQVRHEIAARVLMDPDAFAQAVGWLVQYLAGESDRRPALPVDEQTEACAGADCPAFKAEAAATVQLAEKLALQANQTLDPRIYSLAFQTCRGNPAEACSQLSIQQWSRIDPDNGAPWLFTLQGTGNKDIAAVVDDALFHIGQAKRYDDRFFAVAGEIARHAGNDDRAILGAFFASVDAIGINAAMPLPLDKLLGACRAPALADSNRRQLCEGVADALVNRSDTLLMAIMGAEIGRHLGWDPRRADALHGLQQALIEATPSPFGAADDEAALSCSSLKKFLQRLVRQAAVGELASAREWLAASGRTEAAYTQRAREARLRKSAESQAKAASAAAATSASAPSGQPR